MMLQLQPFKFTVVYKKRKYMYLACTLSRAALNLPTPSDPQEEVFQCISEDATEMFQVELETMALDSPNMYPSTLEEIKAIPFIQYFPLFSCKQYDVITDLTCIIEKH